MYMELRILRKIRDTLKNRYPEIILVLLVFTISILSIGWGKNLISNDNYSPELNPTLSISRYIESPAWRSYRVLGFASESEQADVFRSVIFGVLKPILPDWILGQMFYLVCLFVGSFFIGKLVSTFIKESKLKKYTNLAFLFSSITYLTTLWTMWLFYQSMSPYISNFGFLPLLLWSIYLFVKKDNLKNALFLFLSSIIYSSTNVIATLFVVNFIFISSFVIFLVLNQKVNLKEKLFRILKTIGLFLLTQLFWILPFIHYTATSSGDIINSFTNRTITSSVIDLESDMQTTINSARFYNRTLFEVDNDEYFFPMAEEFQVYDFYKVLGLVPAFFGLLGLIFGIVKKNYKLIFWGVFAIGSWFLIKVTNPPLGEVFVWMQNNIPLFKQVFRWPFSKLGEILLISIVLLSTFGIIYFHSFLGSFFSKRIIKKILIFTTIPLVLLFSLAYAEYMFRGDLFPKRALVEIPNEYFEFGEYLKENELDGRIYYAPPANNNYFREYEWGFWGSQFISYIVPNPIMDMSSAIGSDVSENALLEINNVVRNGNTERFKKLLDQYDVEYVLYDESIVSKGFSFDIDKGKVLSILSGYEKIWESGSLKLFLAPLNNEKIYTEAISDVLNKDIFVKDFPRYPLLSPSGMNIGNLEINGNEILGQFKYEGYSTYVKSNWKEEDIKSLPTAIKLTKDVLELTPSYPYIYGEKNTKPYKQYNGRYDYYVVGNTLFTSNQLEESTSISQTYSSVGVFGIQESDFKAVDFKANLIDKKGNDCSGGIVTESTSVIAQELSSGFNLKGSSELPCVFSKISLPVDTDYVLKIALNWETKEKNFPGFCIYSEDRKECLNKEKFLYSDNPYGDIEVTLDRVIRKNEHMSLILYTVDTNKEFSSESTFREVTIKYANLHNQLSINKESSNWRNEDVFLEDGTLYSIHIPLLFGDTSYIYNSWNNENFLWQPNRPDTGESIFEVSVRNGQYQRVQNDYINQTVNLLTTTPGKQYLMYWNGENISNIPADVCLIYDKEEKCWIQDMLYSNERKSEIKYFEGDSSIKHLNLIFGSTSYKLLTENKLSEFAIMEYPDIWKSFIYSQEVQRDYKEIEMERVFKSVNSTFYKVKLDDLENRYNLVSIPQAKSSGWIAIGRDGLLFNVLDAKTRASIDGWKQAWDISNSTYDAISVIYWPNLLGYLGYAIILLEGAYLVSKLIEKKYERK